MNCFVQDVYVVLSFMFYVSLFAYVVLLLMSMLSCHSCLMSPWLYELSYNKGPCCAVIQG